MQSKNYKTSIVSMLLILMITYADAAQQVSTDANTGAKTWSTKHAGVHFSLTQILPQQGDAFYVNRGFSLEQIKPYTSSCVYMTVLRNDSAAGVIHYIRDNWTVTHKGRAHEFKTVAEWLDFFTAKGIGKPALIAFQWAQFPPEQEYQPGGDWNQGMLAIGLPGGESFDIAARWDTNGEDFSVSLRGVECAQ